MSVTLSTSAFIDFSAAWKLEPGKALQKHWISCHGCVTRTEYWTGWTVVPWFFYFLFIFVFTVTTGGTTPKKHFSKDCNIKIDLFKKGTRLLWPFHDKPFHCIHLSHAFLKNWQWPGISQKKVFPQCDVMVVSAHSYWLMHSNASRVADACKCDPEAKTFWRKSIEMNGPPLSFV